MAAFGEQNLTRKSLTEFAQSQKRYWPNGAVNKIYPTGLGALDINESTEIYAEWVWEYWMHTGDRALLTTVYPVLQRIADYVGVPLGDAMVDSFPDGETMVKINENVRGQDVFIVQPTCPPSSSSTAVRWRCSSILARSSAFGGSIASSSAWTNPFTRSFTCTGATSTRSGAESASRRARSSRSGPRHSGSSEK